MSWKKGMQHVEERRGERQRCENHTGRRGWGGGGPSGDASYRGHRPEPALQTYLHPSLLFLAAAAPALLFLPGPRRVGRGPVVYNKVRKDRQGQVSVRSAAGSGRKA